MTQEDRRVRKAIEGYRIYDKPDFSDSINYHGDSECHQPEWLDLFYVAIDGGESLRRLRRLAGENV